MFIIQMVKSTLQLVFVIFLLQTNTTYADEDQPSIKLLEYLADLEAIDDIWIDPLQMKELSINQVDEPTGDTGNE